VKTITAAVMLVMAVTATGNDPNEPPLLKLAKGTLTVQLYDGVSNIDSVISNWVNSTP
jgi:hypothetical protein